MLLSNKIVIFFALIFTLNINMGMYVSYTKLNAQIPFNKPFVINKSIGLPTNTVNSVAIDDQGFVWIGTAKGLCRWDGRKIILFVHNDSNSNSLLDNYIYHNSLLWDNKTKRLFIGNGKGLSIYNPMKNHFSNFRIDIHNPESLHGEITSIFKDRQETIWISTNNGIAKFDVESETFHDFIYSQDVHKQSFAKIKQIYNVLDIKQDIQNDSILWCSTLGGLLKFNKYSKKFNLFVFSNPKFVPELNLLVTITPHQNRKLYIRTWNDDMMVFDTKSMCFTNHLGPFGTGKNHYPYTIVPGPTKSEHEIWISSYEGIGSYNTETGEVTYYKKFVNNANRAIKLIIDKATKDEMLCVSEFGLYFFKNRNQAIHNYFYSHDKEERFYLPGDIIDLNDKLYLGYFRGDGLYRFDLSKKTYDINKYPLKNEQNYSIFKFSKIKENKYVMLTRKSIYYLNINKDKFIELLASNEDEYFTDMTIDENEEIWVSSKINGLLTFSTADNKFSLAKPWADKHEMGEEINNVHEIFCDSTGIIWFAANNKYGYFTPKSNNIKIFRDNLNVHFFKSFNDDTIWISTRDKGLGYISTQNINEGFQKYLNFGILKSNIVKDITKDFDGNMWLITEAGLEKLSTKDNQTILFNEDEGLKRYDEWYNRDPTESAKLKLLKNGEIVIQYRGGIGIFNPENIELKEQHFSVYLMDVSSNDMEIKHEKSWYYVDEIHLNHNQNSLQIKYSVLDDNPLKKYSLFHRMSSIDKHWVKSSTGEVSYANLKPGKYILQLKAKNLTGKEKMQIRQYQIFIEPPVWGTWWAYLLYFLFGVFLLYTFYRYYYKRKIAQREAKRLKELEKMKSMFYTNITHEFRTPLTVISGLTNSIKSNLEENEKIKYEKDLKIIDKNSKNLLYLVNQLLDMSKLKSGKLKLNPVQNDIIPYLKIIFESFHSLAQAKNVDAICQNEIEHLVMDYDKDKMLIVISNLISNAIKFTPDGGKVYFYCDMTIEKNKKYLVIKVKDTGIGIPEEEISHIFDRFYQGESIRRNYEMGTGIGLALAKEIIELAKGQITVNSELNKGTEFVIKLPVTTLASRSDKHSEIKEEIILQQNLQEENKSINIENESLPLLLIVEDNKDVAGFIASVVKDKYRICFAENGDAGIKKAIEMVPDIIITDLMMPVKDGFELCETLKNSEVTSHIPIVMLTARSLSKDRLKGYSKGADAYLVKPFNIEELEIRLEKLISIRNKLQAKYKNIYSLSIPKDKSKYITEQLFIQKAIKIINENLLNSDFDSLYFSEKMQLSKSQLHRKIKALTGKSTSLFIRHIRLVKAKQLLKATTMNISEIAYDVGFSDPAYFSRVFKDEFGVSPGEVR